MKEEYQHTTTQPPPTIPVREAQWRSIFLEGMSCPRASTQRGSHPCPPSTGVAVMRSLPVQLCQGFPPLRPPRPPVCNPTEWENESGTQVARLRRRWESTSLNNFVYEGGKQGNWLSVRQITQHSQLHNLSPYPGKGGNKWRPQKLLFQFSLPELSFDKRLQ